MSKYISEFKETGNSTINVNLVCKDWNDRFIIYTWINDNEEKYTLVINGKTKNRILCKTKISKKQAIDIVHKLKLIHVKDSTFKSGGAFHTESFIKSEVERISKIQKEKENELTVISNMLFQYEVVLKTM